MYCAIFSVSDCDLIFFVTFTSRKQKLLLCLVSVFSEKSLIKTLTTNNHLSEPKSLHGMKSCVASFWNKAPSMLSELKSLQA